ncbi:hypothetical protein LCGC14_0583440 [marine sediment metagenome]|uniref:Uncharacterized protein n=1 Tax=marine sediment metagenome TaxID=412755 RepID=A0A0F9RKS4_9ZZZZ
MASALRRFNFALRMTAELFHNLDDANVLVPAPIGLDWEPVTPLTSGTTANKLDLELQNRDKALTSAATDDYNLFDGSTFDGTATNFDMLGNAAGFTEVVAVLAHNQSTSAGNMVIGGQGDSTAWTGPFGGKLSTDIQIIHPGGIYSIFAPDDPAYAVANTTNHIFQVLASGGDITYDLVFFGRSA